MVSNGRDPQRLFTAAQRAEIAARQHHRCEVCREQLPAVFHIHHKVSWASGGRTHPGNGMAVCPGCHAIAPVVKLTDFTPREWQAEALPYILPILRGGAFATASAAPGAGKTFFGGWCYQQLAATDDYARMVWFVPNGSLRKQVRDELESMGIYLDTESVTERPGRDGVVLTYHTLSDPAKLEQIIRDADQAPTLFTLDEVHHLAIEKAGKAGMWAWGISRITGTVDRPLHPVLNMSGTLFRSDESERISTIRYRKGLDGSQIETLADYEVNAGRLIREGHLRHIKVLAYDAEMTVQAVDLAKEATGDATIRAVDLDGDRRLQSAVAAALVRDPAFIDGIVAELGTRLGHASAALHGYPVKGLIVVDSKDHADQVYMRAVEQLGTRHVFVAHGDIKSADDEIERFRKSGDQAVLVAVRKVSEGFDAKEVCVLAYLGTWRAPLFISQVAARAMRVTQRERELSRIPATILIPNIGELKAAFADILVGALRVLEAPPEPCERCGRDLCACPPVPRLRPDKICQQCGMPWRHCVCTCGNCGLTPAAGCRCRAKWASACGRCGRKPCICTNEPGLLPDVEVLSDPELSHINVDGHDVDLGIAVAVREQAEADGLDVIHAEQFASSLQKKMEQDPMAFFAYLRRDKK